MWCRAILGGKSDTEMHGEGTEIHGDFLRYVVDSCTEIHGGGTEMHRGRYVEIDRSKYVEDY